MSDTYKTEADVEAVVHGFETCETDKTEFKHRHHLTVAVWYLQDATVDQATERMRRALFAFLEHHDVDRRKYNETITAFWIERVRQVLEDMVPGRTVVEKCNQVIDSLHNEERVEDYYSNAVLASEEARSNFVEPDLKVWRRS